MQGYSDAFVLSQFDYYLKNWKASGHDKNLIHGLMQSYQDEAIRRGLMVYNRITGQIEKVK